MAWGVRLDASPSSHAFWLLFLSFQTLADAWPLCFDLWTTDFLNSVSNLAVANRAWNSLIQSIISYANARKSYELAADIVVRPPQGFVGAANEDLSGESRVGLSDQLEELTRHVPEVYPATPAKAS